MEDLEKAIGRILAVRDCPTVRRLCLDAWALGVKHGESNGLKYAEMYQRCIEEWERARRAAESLASYPKNDGEGCA